MRHYGPIEWPAVHKIEYLALARRKHIHSCMNDKIITVDTDNAIVRVYTRTASGYSLTRSSQEALRMQLLSDAAGIAAALSGLAAVRFSVVEITE